MTSVSRGRRWEYSDSAQVTGYRSAVRSVAWLAIGMFISMFFISGIITVAALVVMIAGSLTPDMLFGADAYAIERLINNISAQLLRNEVFTNSLTIAVSLLSAIIPLLFYKLLRKRKLSLTGFFRPSMPKKAPLAIILAFGIGYLATYAAMLLFALLSGIGINALTPEMPFPSTTVGMVLYFVGVAIVAPVTEEVMFRGIMLRELQPFGSTAAIAITSLLFGFIHGTPYAFFYATAIGLVLAYMTIKTGSILYSVITHMLFNAVSYILQYISSVRPGFEASLVNSGFEIIIFAVSAVTLIWMVRSGYELSLPPSGYPAISKRDYKAGLRRPVVVVFFALTILVALTQFTIG